MRLFRRFSVGCGRMWQARRESLLVAVGLCVAALLLVGCAAQDASGARPAAPVISGSLLPSMAQSPEEQEPAVALGRYAPDFELPDLTGQQVSLSQWRGQTLLVNFWASWCEPCREEMPLLQATYEAYGDDGLMVLGVNMGEEARRVAGFAEDLGLTFPTLVDEKTDVGTLYRVRGAPTTYFIDREGVIRQRYVGPLSTEALETILSGSDAYPNP